jgi:hypothetical protein
VVDTWELFQREWIMYSKVAGVPKDLHKKDPGMSSGDCGHFGCREGSYLYAADGAAVYQARPH